MTLIAEFELIASQREGVGNFCSTGPLAPNNTLRHVTRTNSTLRHLTQRSLQGSGTRLWPPQFFSNRIQIERTIDYDRFLDGSTALEGEPGDILYWPSGYWHIGESTGGFSVGISTALFSSTKAYFDLINHTSRMLSDRLRNRQQATWIRFPFGKADQAIKATAAVTEMETAILKEVAQNSQLKQTLQVSWLDYLTGFGFSRVPQSSTWKSLRDEHIVSGKPNFPILWIPMQTGRYACSASGHSFSIPDHPNIIRLLERLNTGEKSSVSQLLYSYADAPGSADSDIAPQKIRLLLEKLLSLRAIRIA